MGAAIAALLIGSPAAAEAWYQAASNSAAVMYVDTDSRSVRGDTIWVTVMTVALPQAVNDWDQSIIRREISCRNGTSSMMARTFYRQGRAISSASNREPADSHAPGSMMRGVLEAVCGYRTYDAGPIRNPYAAAMTQLRGSGGRK
jgi:hypothetical protein